MKKQYVTPVYETINLEKKDVIQCSGLQSSNEDYVGVTWSFGDVFE